MKVLNIAPSALHVHPRNQEFFDDISGKEYQAFLKSIQENGILEPVLVTQDMTVISGHQRLKGAIELGIRSVPAIIKDDIASEDEATKLLLAANFGRVKNDPIKQAKVYAEYERLCGAVASPGRPNKMANGSVITQQDVANELGVSTDTIQNLKRLLKISPEFQEMISSGDVAAKTGYQVIAKLSPEEQAKLFAALPKDVKLSQREVQEYVAEVLKEKDDDIEDMVERVTVANRAIKQKEADLKEARQAVEAYKKQLEKKERDIAGEFILARDKAVDAARKTEEKYLAKVSEYDKIKSQLEATEKKLREKQAMRSASDVEEMLRFMENACGVMQCYMENMRTIESAHGMPAMITQIENQAQQLIEVATGILNLLQKAA